MADSRDGAAEVSKAKCLSSDYPFVRERKEVTQDGAYDRRRLAIRHATAVRLKRVSPVDAPPSALLKCAPVRRPRQPPARKLGRHLSSDANDELAATNRLESRFSANRCMVALASRQRGG